MLIVGTYAAIMFVPALVATIAFPILLRDRQKLYRADR